MSDLIFSIILPLYKQKAQIHSLIQAYTAALGCLNKNYELLLIINGPDDGSYAASLAACKSTNNLKVFRIEQPGWGRAVKYGISVARGNYICYTNSARTNIDDLIKMLKYAEISNNTIVKATRITNDVFSRKIGSVLYNLEARILFKTPFWDMNGTPKIFPETVLREIEIISDGDLIDVEIIAKCFAKGISFVEMPVVHRKRHSGKSTTTVVSALKMYFGLFLLWRKMKKDSAH